MNNLSTTSKTRHPLPETGNFFSTRNADGGYLVQVNNATYTNSFILASPLDDGAHMFIPQSSVGANGYFIDILYLQPNYESHSCQGCSNVEFVRNFSRIKVEHGFTFVIYEL